MASRTVAWNLKQWDQDYRWPEEGDEWSAWWGDTHAKWLAVLQPRLQCFVPTGSILEIAPGFGRWTQYLKELGDRLVVVDLSDRCIEHCRARFASSTNIEYHANDGKSLAMVDDDSVDLVFSMDSLVHADPTVIESYLTQLASKLTADGVGFIHHSNLGRYERLVRVADRLPKRVRDPLVGRGRLPNPASWRDDTMTAAMFSEMCERAGLACIGQETISWKSGAIMTDAFSLFTKKGSRWERRNRCVENPTFHEEAERMRVLWSAAAFRR